MTPDLTHPPTLTDLRRVHALVRTFVPKHLDTESLAVDILIESWSKAHAQPAVVFIRNRCYDAMRTLGRETRMLDQRPTSSAASPAAEAETNDLVRTLISVLTPLERKIVWYRFYGDLATSEIAKRTQMDVVNVREILSQAMFKMKQAAWE